jgi:hypothetical protein
MKASIPSLFLRRRNYDDHTGLFGVADLNHGMSPRSCLNTEEVYNVTMLLSQRRRRVSVSTYTHM